MNTYSTPEARFWLERLRPGELLLWTGRPRLTVTLGGPVLWAIGPAILFGCVYLYSTFLSGNGAGLAEMLANWQDHTVSLGIMACLVYCAIYLFRFGLLFPSQHLYAITDRRLMIWRRGVSPALVEEELALGVTLERPKRPRNSVTFASEALNYRRRSPFSFAPDPKTLRRVGFLNPQDPVGMEHALTAALFENREGLR